MIRHHVLTRAVYDPAQWTDDAIARRLELFKAVTVPSMAAQWPQWSKPDRWVLAVHPDDPKLHERLEAAAGAGVDLFTHYVTDTGSTRAEAAIAAYRAPWREFEFGYIDRGPTLTTRLDDDDGLMDDAFQRLRHADPRVPTPAHVLMFPVGYRIHQGRYVDVRHNSNALASTLYSPAGDERHIYDHAHRNVRDHYPVLDVDEVAAWLWVRHDDTLSGWADASILIDDHLTNQFPHVAWDKLAAI